MEARNVNVERESILEKERIFCEGIKKELRP